MLYPTLGLIRHPRGYTRDIKPTMIFIVVDGVIAMK